MPSRLAEPRLRGFLHIEAMPPGTLFYDRVRTYESERPTRMWMKLRGRTCVMVDVEPRYGRPQIERETDGTQWEYFEWTVWRWGWDGPTYVNNYSDDTEPPDWWPGGVDPTLRLRGTE